MSKSALRTLFIVMIAVVSIAYWQFGGDEERTVPVPAEHAKEAAPTVVKEAEPAPEISKSAEPVRELPEAAAVFVPALPQSSPKKLLPVKAPPAVPDVRAEVLPVPSPAKVLNSVPKTESKNVEPRREVAPEPIREETAFYAEERKKLETKSPSPLPGDKKLPYRKAVQRPVTEPIAKASEPPVEKGVSPEFWQSAGYALSDTSGEPGLGELRTSVLSVRLGMVSGRHDYRLGLSMVRLEAGTVAPSSYLLYGSATGTPLYESIASASGMALETAYRYTGTHFALSAELGTTPYVHNGIAAAPVGAIELAYRDTGYRLYGRMLQESVKDSMLSYVGNRDIYSGAVWGRVLQRGVEASIEAGEAYRVAWHVGYFPEIAGVRTADNDAWKSALYLSRGMELPGFERFRPGVALAYEDYAFNSEHYTYGHGGYFSPQRHLRASVTLEMLMRLDSEILLQARGAAGYSTFDRASAAVYPLDPADNRRYAAESEQFAHLQSSVTAGWQVSANAALLAGAGYRNSRGMDESFVQFVIAFFPQARGIGEEDLARVDAFRER